MTFGVGESYVDQNGADAALPKRKNVIAINVQDAELAVQSASHHQWACCDDRDTLNLRARS